MTIIFYHTVQQLKSVPKWADAVWFKVIEWLKLEKNSAPRNRWQWKVIFSEILGNGGLWMETQSKQQNSKTPVRDPSQNHSRNMLKQCPHKIQVQLSTTKNSLWLMSCSQTPKLVTKYPLQDLKLCKNMSEPSTSPSRPGVFRDFPWPSPSWPLSLWPQVKQFPKLVTSGEKYPAVGWKSCSVVQKTWMFCFFLLQSSIYILIISYPFPSWEFAKQNYVGT